MILCPRNAFVFSHAFSIALSSLRVFFAVTKSVRPLGVRLMPDFER